MAKGAIRKITSLALILIIGFLLYYQFLYKATHVDSNIFRLSKTLAGHTSDIWTVKFSLNSQWLASGSVDSTIKLWNRDNGAIIRSIKQPAGVTCLSFSPDGTMLASAAYDEKVRLWKIPEGTLLKEFIGHRGTVWSVDFSPDGKTIASSGEDSTIRLWNVSSGELVNKFLGHKCNIWDVKFSPDGKTLASGSFDNTIRIWNVSDGKLLHTITAHSQAVVSLAFSPDGEKLVSTSDDKTSRLWNTKNWALMQTFNTPEHQQASDFSPDTQLLVTGGRDKPAIGEFLQNFFGDSRYNTGISMRLWNVQSGALLQTFSFHANDVNDVSFSNDGRWIAAASSDKTVSLWELSK